MRDYGRGTSYHFLAFFSYGPFRVAYAPHISLVTSADGLSSDARRLLKLFLFGPCLHPGFFALPPSFRYGCERWTAGHNPQRVSSRRVPKAACPLIVGLVRQLGCTAGCVFAVLTFVTFFGCKHNVQSNGASETSDLFLRSSTSLLGG